jgi:hypothetical protein
MKRKRIIRLSIKLIRSFKPILLLGFIMCILTSCEKWIDTDINKNPDSPDNVSLKLLLPSAEAQIAYTVGGFDIAGTTSMWMQYIRGTARQAQIIDNYGIKESDMVNAWDAFYSGSMMDLHQIISKADSAQGNKSPYFAGVARVLMAYTLGTATDLWGNIPYREAFRGDKMLTPSYDEQKQIYSDIQTLLDKAIADFSQPISNNAEALEGDLIYNNNPDLWKKAAWSLKVRYLLHLSKVAGDSIYTQALNIINGENTFSSSANELKFNFGYLVTEQNPLYQFAKLRGDASGNPAFIQMLELANDPRHDVYKAPGNAPELFAGPYFGSPNSPVMLMSFVELWLLKAESEYFKPTMGDARNTLVEAVTVSLNQLGVYNKSWINTYTSKVSQLNDSALYTEIMKQKYIALFMQPEAFAAWRKTVDIQYPMGIPALKPIVTNGTIPRRFPYSSEERLYNKNMPDITSIYTPVWWDK